MAAAAAASADRESPHDAEAMALSPATRIMQAESLTKFKAWVGFIVFSF
jgi:hypothetical protein